MKNLNQLITELGMKLKQSNLTLVTAESCTGGGLAYFIVCNKACSALLERGYIVYSNQSKQDLLGIKPEKLQLFGAVSKEIALEMAQGALKQSAAQISIGITGIAGSDKKEKQSAGEVWICIASVFKKEISFRKQIKGGRKNFLNHVMEESVKALIQYIDKF